MNNLKKFIFLLDAKERKNALYLLVLIFIMALLDTIGVASILPFTAILTNPSLIDTNIFINFFYKKSSIFGVEDKQQFIFMLGILLFFLLVFSLFFKAITTYFQLRFIQMREYSISKRLFENYINQPYSWFLDNNSADFGKNILSEVQQLVLNGIRPTIELISKSMVTISIILMLFLVDYKLSLIVGLVLSSSYIIIFLFVRKYVKYYGSLRLLNNELRFKTVIEAFAAIKEVKVSGLEHTFKRKYSKSAKIYSETQASSQIISQLPRYILEAIAFGGILLVILYMFYKTGNFTKSIPIISLYAFAGYRLLPALQLIYSSFTQLSFINASIVKLHSVIINIKPINIIDDQNKIIINKMLKLNNIFFNYPNSSRIILKNLSLAIPVNSTVGLIGSTGSGKTTLVDIILGLLEIQKGSIEVDGKLLTKKHLKAWHRNIGYVPQNIFLSDDTIYANIAFGRNQSEIDYETVEKVSKIANLHNFITSQLPEKYNTRVGERGIKLSGGQRQRIGIARALYNNPNILIFDEATSALDNDTENKIIHELNSFNKNITTIIIAHRLNSLKYCDAIYKIEKGQIYKIKSHKDLFEDRKIQ